MRQQQVLDGDVLVLEPLGLVLGAHQDLLQPLGEIDLARLDARARDLGPARQLALDLGLERLGGHLHAGEQAGDQPLRLLQQREEKMLAVDLLVAIAQRLGLGALERLLGFLGQLVDVHVLCPLCRRFGISWASDKPRQISFKPPPLHGRLAPRRAARYSSRSRSVSCSGMTMRISASRSPLPPPDCDEPAPAQPDLAAGGGAGRDAHPHRAAGGLDLGLAAQRGFRRRDRDVGEDVRALDPEARVGRDLDLQEEIARRAAAHPLGALAGQADLLP